jgi:hypothetical protein
MERDGREADGKAERKKGGGKRICRARDRFHPLHTTERNAQHKGCVVTPHTTRRGGGNALLEEKEGRA